MNIEELYCPITKRQDYFIKNQFCQNCNDQKSVTEQP